VKKRFVPGCTTFLLSFLILSSFCFASTADLNHDGIVDILDISIVARGYGSKRGDERWNPEADLDNDGAINILDVVRVAKEIGKKWGDAPTPARLLDENERLSPELYAQKVDMYICHFEVAVAGKVQQIHALRPDLICLLYRNMREVYQSSDEFQLFLDHNGILKDAYGNLIHSAVYTSNWIVDPGNPDYQQWVANWIKSYLDKYGFNGVMLDNCLPSNEYMWNTAPGPPINPRTGKPWTSDEFNQAVIALVNKVKDTVGDRLVVGNGIFTGRFFNDPSRQQHYVNLLLRSKIDGIMSEGLFSDLDSADWYSEQDWLDSVNFVVWLENNFLSRGKLFLPLCENADPTDGSGPVLPAGCTKEQYVTYCFSSLLLPGAETNGTHYLNLGLYMLEDYPQSLFRFDLGSPLGAYYTVQGTHVYARDFSNVKVLVNPTYQTYSIDLDGNYTTLKGQVITSPLTVGSHTGMILKRLTVASALAHVYIECANRADLIVDIGVGDPANPVGTLRIWDGGGVAAQNLDLTVDVSAGLAYLPPSETNRWFLQVYDAAAEDQGRIVRFTITYNRDTYASTDTPAPITGLQTSYAFLPSLP
jgi:hypothetical protein